MSRRRADEDSACWNRPGTRLTPLCVGFAIRKGIAYTRIPDLKQLAIGRRYGVDIILYLGGTELRVLVMQLKSGCFSNTEDSREDNACYLLNEQILLVKQWIDARPQAGQAAIVLGDFNRRLTEPGDSVWAELNDAIPSAYTLISAGHRQVCKGHYESAPYIDHVLANSGALDLIGSELIPLQYQETGEAAPSDHCPVSVGVRLN